MNNLESKKELSNGRSFFKCKRQKMKIKTTDSERASERARKGKENENEKHIKKKRQQYNKYNIRKATNE